MIRPLSQHDSSNTTAPPVVTIGRGIQHCLMFEPDGVIDVTVPRITMADDSAVMSRTRESLLHPPASRAGVVDIHPNIGLAEPLAYALQQRGVVVQSTLGSTILPLPVPVNNAATTGYTQTLDLIRDSVTSLIRRGPGVSPANLIATMSHAWPHAKIAVGMARHEDAQRLVDQLRKLGVEADNVTTRYCPDDPSRVVVGTFTSLAHPEIGMADRHILVLPHALDALRDDADWCLLAAESQFRIVGMLDMDATPSPYEQARLTATFGPREITLPKPGHVLDLPRIYSIKHRTHHGAIAGNGGLQALVWKNPIRNRRIAQHAKLASSWQLSPPPSPLGIEQEPVRRVIVMAANIEQANQLAKRLPGWPIECGDTTNLSRRQQNTLDQRRRQWPFHGTIATPDGIHNVTPANSGVTLVLWAGAGCHLPPIPENWFVRRDGQDRSIRVVDVEDTGERSLCEQFRRRQSAYRRAGWIAANKSAVEHRIEAFLRSVTVEVRV